MSGRVIDLHSHSTHSDGSVAAAELVMMAAINGAAAIALTDHDTVTGVEEARRAASAAGVEFVSGLEISAEYSPGTMHILGYYVDEKSSALLSKLVDLKLARENRNPKITERLQDLGCDIEYCEVAALAGNKVVGRPHFARLMVERGYAQSIQDAFDRFLKKGAPAYVEKVRLSPASAISIIHRAGGAAVLAHPYQLGLSSVAEVEALVGELAQLGLDGIEAIYSRHTPAERSLYSKMAVGMNLVVTGGSDFHGSYKPDISIVSGKGDLQVPYELLEELRARARMRGAQAAASPPDGSQ